MAQRWTRAMQGFLLCSLVALPAAAQTPIIGEIAPGTVVGRQLERRPPCVSDTEAMPHCGEHWPVVFGLRDNLGDAYVRIEDMVRRNPLARIGWSSEFELSRSGFRSDELAMFDMFNPPLIAAQGAAAGTQYANNYDYQGIYNEGTVGRKIELGRIDDPALPARFDAALREIVRVRSLNLLSGETSLFPYALCIETWDLACPETGGSDRAGLFTGDRVHVGVRNESDEPLYLYVLLAGPGLPVRLVAGSMDSPLAPGALAPSIGDPFDLGDGRHQFFVIRSRTPVDARVFSEETRRTGRGPGCITVLERRLCTALSGTSVTIAPAHGEDWSMAADALFVRTKQAQVVGGGDVAPRGFAPWQVQIFSNQAYSVTELALDWAKGAQGKMLLKQERFQRNHRCAGSLIAPNIVLTAAHCVAKPPVDGTKVLTMREVRVGTQNLREGGAVYRIDAVLFHNGYKPGNQKDDIALLRIAPKGRPIAQRPIKTAVDVPGMARIVTGSPMEVLGWGYTEVVKRGERHERPADEPQFVVDQLRIAPMVAFDQTKCRAIKGYGDINKKICAVTPAGRAGNDNTFSCRNDSGGPVIQRSPSGPIQIGLVSGGVGCGAEENGVQNPSLFVDLQLFKDWIISAKTRLLKMPRGVEKHP